MKFSVETTIGIVLALVCTFVPLTSSAQSSLRGSKNSVERVYSVALRKDADFFESGQDVRRAVKEGSLVRIENSLHYQLHQVSYPYVRAETYSFVKKIAREYYSACKEPLVITSAVRPLSIRLRNSVDHSVHPTGMAIDLRKPAGPCLKWLRNKLMTYEGEGVVDATEEFRPPHFHVAVLKGGTRVRVASADKEDLKAKMSVELGESSSSSSAEVKRKLGSAMELQQYTVRRGDSLWGLARRHDVTVEELQAANNMSGTKVKVGDKIFVPVKGR